MNWTVCLQRRVQSASLCKVLQTAVVLLVRHVAIPSLNLLLATELWLCIQILLIRHLESTRTGHCVQVSAVPTHHAERCLGDV